MLLKTIEKNLESIVNNCKYEDSCFLCSSKKECEAFGGNPQGKLRKLRSDNN